MNHLNSKELSIYTISRFYFRSLRDRPSEDIYIYIFIYKCIYMLAPPPHKTYTFSGDVHG